MRQDVSPRGDFTDGSRGLADRLAVSLAAAVPSLEAPHDPIEAGWSRIGAARLELPVVEGVAPQVVGNSIADALDAALRAGTRLRAFAEIFDVGLSDASAENRDGEALAGVAFAYKDVFSTPRRVPEAGTGRPWPDLAERGRSVIAKLEANGALAIGATNLDSWCYATLGLSSLAESPLHPADPDLLVGGSSSGSAVAVAAGIVPFALGTDTGGSTRIPAALCGVFGFKPTNGLLPTAGAIPLSRSHDCIGILARDARTISGILHVLAAPDSPIRHLSKRAPLLGIARGAFAECDDLVQSALQVLERRSALAGSAIDVELPDLTLCNDAATVITAVEAYSVLARPLAEHPDAFPETIKMRLAVGRLTTADTYERAQRLRAMALPAVMASLFDGADFVVAPVTRRARVRISEIDSGGNDAYMRANLDLLRFNRWVNLFGFPSLAMPVRDGEGGLLAGVQIIGRPYSDLDLLDCVSRLSAD